MRFLFLGDFASFCHLLFLSTCHSLTFFNVSNTILVISIENRIKEVDETTNLLPRHRLTHRD
nr:MAG TPA: hypothetical protein [Caudoviricetes sp.]